MVLLMASTQGKNNKLLQKIYKALKLPKDSNYLKDIVDIAEIKVLDGTIFCLFILRPILKNETLTS